MIKEITQNSKTCPFNWILIKCKWGLFWAESHLPSEFGGNLFCHLCAILLTNQRIHQPANKRTDVSHRTSLNCILFNDGPKGPDSVLRYKKPASLPFSPSRPFFLFPPLAALLHRDLRLHRQRGLHQPPQRNRGVLHLQPQPERLQLRRLHGLHGLPLLHGLPGSGRVLPPDQQRQRPQEGGAG